MQTEDRSGLPGHEIVSGNYISRHNYSQFLLWKMLSLIMIHLLNLIIYCKGFFEQCIIPEKKFEHVIRAKTDTRFGKETTAMI